MQEYDFINNPDPRIITFQKALGGAESNNTPAPKDTRITKTEGSVGRFQFRPATFADYSNRYFKGTNPVTGKPLDIYDDFDQKLVNYAYVADKMKQINPKTGKPYSPQDVAASWNAGEGALTDWTTRKGVNKYGNAYDVPAYVEKVMHNFNEAKKQYENPKYEPIEYDPAIHSESAKLKDQEALASVKERNNERVQDYNKYLDYDTGSPVLNFLKNVAGRFGQGGGNEASREVGKLAALTNSGLRKLGMGSDNPLLIPGSETNKFYTDEDGAYNSEGALENTGEWVGWGARQATLFKAASVLGNAAEGATMAGKFGQPLANLANKSGFIGGAARAIPGEIASSIPFMADQAVEDQDLTAGNVVGGLALAGAFGLGRGAWAKYLGDDLIAKAVALKGAGKLDEYENLIKSADYKIQEIKRGLSTPEGKAKAIETETNQFRDTLPDFLPKKLSTGVNDPNSANYISDEAIRAFLGVSDAKLTSDNLLDMTNTLKRVTAREKEVLFPSEQAVKDGAIGIDQLAESISKNRANPAANIDIGKFKQDVLNIVENSSMVNKEKTKRFVERELDDVASKKPEDTFVRLHDKRKALNEDYVASGDNDATFLANQIRNKVKEYADDPAVGFYLKMNKEYETLQSVKKIANAMHRTNMKKGLGGQMLPLLFGYTAGSFGGGIVSPALFYAGTRAGEKLQSRFLNRFTAQKAANKIMGGSQTKLSSEQQKIADEFKRITGEMGKQDIKAGVSEVKKAIIRAERNLTPKNLNEAFDTLLKNKDNPEVEPLLERVETLVKRMEKKQGEEKTAKMINDFLNEPYAEKLPTIQAGKPGVSKYKEGDPNLPLAPDEPPATFSRKEGEQNAPLEEYIPEDKLPVIQTTNGGNQPVNTLGQRAKEALKRTSKGLPTILGLAGLGYAISPDVSEASPAMEQMATEQGVPDFLPLFIHMAESAGGKDKNIDPPNTIRKFTIPAYNGNEKSRTISYEIGHAPEFGLTPSALGDLAKSQKDESKSGTKEGASLKPGLYTPKQIREKLKTVEGTAELAVAYFKMVQSSRPYTKDDIYETYFNFYNNADAAKNDKNADRIRGILDKLDRRDDHVLHPNKSPQLDIMSILQQQR